LLRHAPPEYPPVAKVNYLEGQVQIEITVNDRGHVSSTHILQGNPILASAALKAVNQWAYRPLATSTGPVGFIAIVKLRFSIHHPTIQLTSKQAEKDFQRQVKPSRILTASNEMPSDGVVHMRLLVNDEGQVIDKDSTEMDKAQFKAACENLRGWTFAPARWGTMPVASYLNVDVPVVPPPVTRAAANPIVH
jgi:TonB family protein